MPTYEYRCRDCGRDFEVFQRMSDRPGAPCPGCGRPAERLISGGAGFLFKGDGFYITDHRSEDYRRMAREEADAKPDKETAKAHPGEAAPTDEKRTQAGKRGSGREKASRAAAASGKRTRRSGTPSAASDGRRRRGDRTSAGSAPGSGGGATGGEGT